jgi:glycosyltransferase involved in cell wall biosynthesis
MPRVSLIIPAYNGERFIAAALDSILHQTYQDFEIIVVNDGSTDGTATVLEHYRSRIHWIDQMNQGVAIARNRGLAMAQGEFIAFLDQDDVLLPDKLADQINCFEQYPELSIVHSGWRLVNAAAHPIADVEPWQEAPVLDATTWICRMPVLFSAMLFRRTDLLRVNGLDPQFKQACDVDLIQRLVLANCQSRWLKQITVLYRQHGHNDSLNTIVQASESWAVREQFFARSDLPPALRQIERESRYYTLVWIAWRLYWTGHLHQMIDFLQRSLAYSPFLKTETILHWITSFTRYAAQQGQDLDTFQLTGSPEWQALMQYVMAHTDRTNN